MIINTESLNNFYKYSNFFDKFSLLNYKKKKYFFNDLINKNEINEVDLILLKFIFKSNNFESKLWKYFFQIAIILKQNYNSTNLYIKKFINKYIKKYFLNFENLESILNFEINLNVDLNVIFNCFTIFLIENSFNLFKLQEYNFFDYLKLINFHDLSLISKNSFLKLFNLIILKDQSFLTLIFINNKILEVIEFKELFLDDFIFNCIKFYDIFYFNQIMEKFFFYKIFQKKAIKLLTKIFKKITTIEITTFFNQILFLIENSDFSYYYIKLFYLIILHEEYYFKLKNHEIIIFINENYENFDFKTKTIIHELSFYLLKSSSEFKLNNFL